MAPATEAGALAGGDRLGIATRHPALFALVLLLLALAVRLPALDRSLWLDECFSMSMASQDPIDLARAVRNEDTHPPGYYLALNAWLGLAPSDLGARVFSLTLNLLHVLLLGLVARRLLGARAGWVAAALGAVGGEVAWPAGEVRSFALTGLLLTLAWLLALEALERGRAWRYALAALPFACALWSFYYAALGALALGAFALAWEPAWRRRAALAAAGLAAGLSLLPWIPALRDQAARVVAATDAGRAGLTLDTAGLLNRWLAQHTVTLGPWFSLGGALVLVPLLVAWQRRRAWGWRWQPAPDEQPRALRALGVLVVAYLLAVLGAGLAGSFVGRRYATFLAGVWCVVAAGVHARLSPRIQPLVLALLVAGGAVTTFVRELEPRHGDWRSAAAWVAARTTPDDLVGVEPGFQIVSWRHYARPPRAPAAGLPHELPRSAAGEGATSPGPYVGARDAAAVRVWVGARHVLWLVRGQGRSRPRDDALAAVLDADGWRRTHAEPFPGLAVERWERAPR